MTNPPTKEKETFSYYSNDYYCQSLVILVGFSNGSRTTLETTARDSLRLFFKIHLYEIIIDLTEAPGRSRQHGAKKSGSTVLFLFHFIGVDDELSALFEKHRMSTAKCSKSSLFSVKWIFP